MFSNQKLERILFSPMHATCLTITSVLDLILPEIFVQECTSSMFSLGGIFLTSYSLNRCSVPISSSASLPRVTIPDMTDKFQKYVPKR